MKRLSSPFLGPACRGSGVCVDSNCLADETVATRFCIGACLDSSCFVGDITSRLGGRFPVPDRLPGLLPPLSAPSRNHPILSVMDASLPFLPKCAEALPTLLILFLLSIRRVT